MKKLVLSVTAMAVLTSSAIAQEITGDAKLACEALLCLSSPNRPQECNSALKKYYSITDKKAHKQTQKRENFLKLCPKQ
jgi:hypothetical protein